MAATDFRRVIVTGLTDHSSPMAAVVCCWQLRQVTDLPIVLLYPEDQPPPCPRLWSGLDIYLRPEPLPQNRRECRQALPMVAFRRLSADRLLWTDSRLLWRTSPDKALGKSVSAFDASAEEEAALITRVDQTARRAYEAGGQGIVRGLSCLHDPIRLCTSRALAGRPKSTWAVRWWRLFHRLQSIEQASADLSLNMSLLTEGGFKRLPMTVTHPHDDHPRAVVDIRSGSPGWWGRLQNQVLDQLESLGLDLQTADELRQAVKYQLESSAGRPAVQQLHPA